MIVLVKAGALTAAEVAGDGFVTIVTPAVSWSVCGTWDEAMEDATALFTDAEFMANALESAVEYVLLLAAEAAATAKGVFAAAALVASCGRASASHTIAADCSDFSSSTSIALIIAGESAGPVAGADPAAGAGPVAGAGPAPKPPPMGGTKSLLSSSC